MAALKSLIVYHTGGTWYGSEVEWYRSGSGFYRNIVGVPIPQSKAEIETFAAGNHYKVEWRGAIPEEAAARG